MGDDTLGDSKFLGYFQLGTSTLQSSNNSTTSLECLCLAQVFSEKLNPSTSSHRQSSGASLRGGNWASKLHRGNWNPPIWRHTKRDISSRGIY
ncbi:hypothetical protein TNCV_4365811 [Trichonephila clavipes]|nr:hypothetical protein TNCV_4365811 [Trichonephila clavipes]